MRGTESGRRAILGLTTGGNFSQLGSRLLVSPLVPAIMLTFDVSKSAIGLSLTGMWATYAVFQYPGGTLADRFDERRILLLSLGLVAVALLTIAWAPEFVVFGLAVVFLGAGAGLYFPVASSMLTKRFTRTGQALSVMTAGGSVAGLVYPAAAGYLETVIGWRLTIVIGAGVALLVFVVGAVLTNSPTKSEADRSVSGLSLSAVTSILTDPAVLYTIAIAGSMGFVWQGLSSFFPTFLVEYREVSTTQAGVAFGVLFLLSAVAQPVVGRISDRFTREVALIVSGVLAASGLFIVLATSTIHWLLVGVVILGTGISWPGVMQAKIMDHFTDENRGSGFGLVRALYMGLGSLGSIVVGTVAETYGWPFAYGLVIAIICVVLASLFYRLVR